MALSVPDLKLWAELKRIECTREDIGLPDDLGKTGMVSVSFVCILQPYLMLRKNTQCCYNGKGRLYKLLNAGVPIIVAHMVLLKIMIS